MHDHIHHRRQPEVTESSFYQLQTYSAECLGNDADVSVLRHGDSAVASQTTQENWRIYNTLFEIERRLYRDGNAKRNKKESRYREVALCGVWRAV
ncbi:hypothetical protein [Herbaspirillum lusitanum]|uniref:hypothetical protein n=1 Tax=Herbaspirillum lusitanum TaxID=213312 RepID=UPI002238D6C0|nr:hypothetical protein [Herbaspirillum lusitanum]